MTDNKYSSPAAFKQALEQRLKNMTSTGAKFARKRQLLVADASLPHMGLTTWKHAPDDKVLKSDASVAKNYLKR